MVNAMKEKKKSILSKLSFYQIVWIFVIGCFCGYIFEVVWYFIRHHVWINKQGLLFGPFQPIYGFGAIVLTLFLKPVENSRNVWIFLYGILLGSVYEYVASLFQEYVFGTFTWIYSQWGWSLNGRIYLPYCIAWGALALVWIRLIYPWLSNLLGKIPTKIAKICTWAMAIFMIFNLSLSGIANYRFGARAKGIPASNAFTKWVDQTYNDDYMHKKFTKLRIVQK